MTVSVVYVHPILGGDHYTRLAIRFLHTYHAHPPGMEHKMVVVCNANPPSEETAFLFGSIPNAEFLLHDNSGFDLGAYQAASRVSDSEMIVFFGASTYLKKAGWLKRMADVYQHYGPGLYGAMGNRGVAPLGVHPHIRTTAFWTSPQLFNTYPHTIVSHTQRYGFEHGPDCLTSWFYKNKKRVMVAGWSGAYEQGAWDSIPNGYHRGDQSDLLAGDRNSAPPFHGCE